MTALALVLVFAVTPAFPGPALAVARTVGVLGLIALLTAQRLVGQIDEASFLRFHGQQLALQDGQQAHLTQILASQKSANLRPMPRFGPDGPSNLNGAHASPMQAKRCHTANRQAEYTLLQTDRLQKPLDAWQCFLHNHVRDSFSVGDNLA